MTPLAWDYNAAGMPPDLQKLVGLRVYKAWVNLRKGLLCLRLQGGNFAMFQAHKTDIPGKEICLQVEVGMERTGVSFDDLDLIMPQTPHTRELRGRRFTGLDGEVVMFDHRYGLKMTPDGVSWVKVKEQEKEESKPS